MTLGGIPKLSTTTHSYVIALAMTRILTASYK